MLGEGRRRARAERGARRFTAAFQYGKYNLLRDAIKPGQRAGPGGGAVKNVCYQALLGGMLERCRGLFPLRGNGEVVLRMGKQVQLRRACRPGQRNRKKKA